MRDLIVGNKSSFRRKKAGRTPSVASNLAVAHVTLGWVASVIDYDVGASRDHLERAVSLDPGNAPVQIAYSRTAAAFQPDKAVAAASKAVQLDPISPWAHQALALAHYSSRQFADAEAASRRAILLDPAFPGVRGGLAIILLQTGKLEEARAEAKERSSGSAGQRSRSPMLGSDAPSRHARSWPRRSNAWAMQPRISTHRSTRSSGITIRPFAGWASRAGSGIPVSPSSASTRCWIRCARTRASPACCANWA